MSAVVDATWIFRRAEEQLEVRRSSTDNGCFLVISSLGCPRSYRFSDMGALLNFQADMEAFLLRTGWSFVEFRPERRTGRERRTWPRLTERRRWWTDGLLLPRATPPRRHH